MTKTPRTLTTIGFFLGGVLWLVAVMWSVAWADIDVTIAIGLSPFAAGFGLLIGTALG